MKLFKNMEGESNGFGCLVVEALKWCCVIVVHGQIVVLVVLNHCFEITAMTVYKYADLAAVLLKVAVEIVRRLNCVILLSSWCLKPLQLCIDLSDSTSSTPEQAGSRVGRGVCQNVS